MRRRAASLLTLAALAAACAANRPIGRGAVDLTQRLDQGIPFAPGGIPFETIALDRPDGAGERVLSIGERTGTHVDAPARLGGGLTVDRIPAERLAAPLVVVDLRGRVRFAWDYAATAEDLLAHERAHGKIRSGDFVAFLTGWSAFWSDPERYRNPDRRGLMLYPGVDSGAARLLVARGVVGVGIDALSIDPGPAPEPVAAQALAEGGAYVVLNLTGLEALPPTGTRVVVAPLPVADAAAAPARVIALLPEPPR